MYTIYIVATDRMTTSWRIIAGYEWITVNWRNRLSSPYWIKESILCRTYQSTEPYLNDTRIIGSSETSATLQDLRQWSSCDFTFTAVYNPATLDPGKHINAMTSKDCTVISLTLSYNPASHCQPVSIHENINK